MALREKAVRWIIRQVFRLVCRGGAPLTGDQGGCLVVCNHQAAIDGMILASLLTEKSWLIVSKERLPAPLQRWFFPSIHFMEAESLQQEGWSSLLNHWKRGGVALHLPESVPTENGSFAKMDEGSCRAAREAGIPVIAAHLNGTQYHPSSSREASLPRHLFPKVTLSLLPPDVTGVLLPDLLGRALVAHFQGQGTLWGAVCRVARIHGFATEIITDSTGVTLSYRGAVLRAILLGEALVRRSKPKERVGVFLPTSAGGVVTFLALHAIGRTPALLNFTSSSRTLISACRTAGIQTVLTSRLFVKKGGFVDKVASLAKEVTVLYLEDLRPEIGPVQKVVGLVSALWPERRLKTVAAQPDQEAVILFTSGSEGEPKGVVLSHDNILCNIHQIRTRITLHADDHFLNVLPMFHAFGLTVGTLAPLLAGVRCHYHPSPLEYRNIPELAYRIKATVLAGTNTFLAGYGRMASPVDFHSIRLVVAGAEALRAETRALWMEKFGIRIFEGYGTTEGSPVLAVNTALHYQAGTVGRLLPGIDHHLMPVPGVEAGGVLLVRGANIMKGYLQPDGCGQVQRPETPLGLAWYDTGDVVGVDALGFLRIIGRIKRFAKVGGEMISLATVERCAATVWPDTLHVVEAIPHPKKGERLCMVSEERGATRPRLLEEIKAAGLSPLHLPDQILFVKEIPLQGSGKVDYPKVRELLAELS
ncbi:MAG: AMP-binding protein [Magnetococcales bacterium]|nr:AMP-binding protein [Magnetococcales bacterium]